MNYVMHFCRNSRLSERNKNYCNNGWIDKDLTNVSTNPPSWKYCKDCAAKLGINFKNQKPDDFRTEEEKEKIHNHLKKMLLAKQNKN